MMEILLCADMENGVFFNGRRQSQDRGLRKRILRRIGREKLYVTPYSAKQFMEDEWDGKLEICGNPLAEARAAYCFVEDCPLAQAADREDIEAIVIYRWDKVYPADTWLKLPANGTHASDWLLCESTSFAGYSHEKITEEVYRRGRQ